MLFLTVWGSNLHKGLYGADSYAGVVRGYADGGEAPALWKDLMGFIADHATVFARLQFVGELALGVLLVIGLWLRIVGVLAWAFLLGLWISEIGAPGEWAWSLVFPGVVALAVAFVPEARRWSLDARRHR